MYRSEEANEVATLALDLSKQQPPVVLKPRPGRIVILEFSERRTPDGRPLRPIDLHVVSLSASGVVRAHLGPKPQARAPRDPDPTESWKFRARWSEEPEGLIVRAVPPGSLYIELTLSSDAARGTISSRGFIFPSRLRTRLRGILAAGATSVELR